MSPRRPSEILEWSELARLGPGVDGALRRTLRVVIADDDPLYRESISRALWQDPAAQLVGQARSGRDAVELIARLEPDVAVLELRMPDLQGPQILLALRRRGATARVLFLSAHPRSELADRIVDAGAQGCLFKGLGGGEVCAAIQTVARGATVVAPQIRARPAARVDPPGPSAELPDRGGRMLLELLGEGLKPSEMAERLGSDLESIRSRLRQLYSRLGVSEPTSAVAEAMRQGLIGVDKKASFEDHPPNRAPNEGPEGIAQR